MNHLVDLDKLLDDFEKAQIGSESNVEQDPETKQARFNHDVHVAERCPDRRNEEIVSSGSPDRINNLDLSDDVGLRKSDGHIEATTTSQSVTFTIFADSGIYDNKSKLDGSEFLETHSPVEETVKLPCQNVPLRSTNEVSDCKSEPTPIDEEAGTSTDLENPSFTLESVTYSQPLACEQSVQCFQSDLTPQFKKIDFSGTETALLPETVPATHYENSSATITLKSSEALYNYEDSTNQMPISTMESTVEAIRTIQDPPSAKIMEGKDEQSCSKEAEGTAQVVGSESHGTNTADPPHSPSTEHENPSEPGSAMFEEQNHPIASPENEGTTNTDSSTDAPAPSFPVFARDPPEWAADGSSPVCMSCGTRFTMLRRRHHCRACGRLLCASCTPHRVPLPTTFSTSTSSTEPSLIRLVSGSSPHNDSAEPRLHRACIDCFNLVNAASYDGNTQSRRHQTPDSSVASTSAAPSQRLESPPTILASPSPPVSTTPLPVPSSSSAQPRAPIQRRPYSPQLAVSRLKDDCLIPMDDAKAWPPLVVSSAPELILEPRPPACRISQLLEAGGTVSFAVTRNLHVLVGCHSSSSSIYGAVWYFASHGLYAVGQEEVGLLIRRRDCESLPPLDALWQYYLLYDMALTGSSAVQPCSFAQAPDPIDEGFCLLTARPGTKTTGGPSWFDDLVSGFLYVRATSFHPLHDLSPLYPSPPALFGLLLHPREVAWASHLPLRLLLSWGYKLGAGAYPFPLVSDRDREPVFGDADPTSSILSIFPTGAGLPEMCLIHVPELEVLISSEIPGNDLQQDQSPELRLQLLLRRSSHDHVRRMVCSLGQSDSLLFGMAGDFSPSADSHFVCVAQSSGPTTAFRTEVISAPSTSAKKLTGASFVVIEGGASQSCLSVVEDGCMVHLTTEQFKALISKMRSASPLQLHIETAQVLPSSSPEATSGALITVDWLDNPMSVHPTTVHYSWIDGRLVEPRCTFPVPPEHQLRHWLMHQSLAEAQALSPSSSPLISETCSFDGGPRITWTRLHSLCPQPVYAVDNRSGDALDLFAVFNTIASTFVGAIFPYSRKLRMANHRSIALRVLLQPPNTFNFFVGSSNGYCGWSPRFALTSDHTLAPSKGSSDWWKVTRICAEEPPLAEPSLTPLIDDPGYVNGLDSALIPLLDGLAHNISCSWFFAQTLSEGTELSSLTSPGLLLEFDFNLLD